MKKSAQAYPTHLIFSDEDAKEAIAASKKITKEVTRSKEAARAYLVKLGTHTKSGKLHRNYGG